MIEDLPLIKDLRQIRQAISERFNHDLKKYLEYLRTMEQAAQSTTANLPGPHTLERKSEVPSQLSS